MVKSWQLMQLPETLCVSTKLPHQEFRWNYGILCSGYCSLQELFISYWIDENLISHSFAVSHNSFFTPINFNLPSLTWGYSLEIPYSFYFEQPILAMFKVSVTSPLSINQSKPKLGLKTNLSKNGHR